MIVHIILEGPVWMLSYFPFLVQLGNLSSVPGGPGGTVITLGALSSPTEEGM